VGEREGALVVRVTAPPVDGRANDALCTLIAKRLGIPPSRVRLARGHTSRDKFLRIEGVDGDAARRLLLG
jgi:uncharacterized protein YggU (UPF0235/DUF167 family)